VGLEQFGIYNMKIHIYKEDGGHIGNDFIYTQCGIYLNKKNDKHLYRKSVCKSVSCKSCYKIQNQKKL